MRTLYCKKCKGNCGIKTIQGARTGKWWAECTNCPSAAGGLCESSDKAFAKWLEENPEPQPTAEPIVGTPLECVTHPIHLFCKYCNAERTIEIRREVHCYSMWCSQCSATVSRVNSDTQPTEEEMRALWVKHNQKPKVEPTEGCGRPAPQYWTLTNELYYCSTCKSWHPIELHKRESTDGYYEVRCSQCNSMSPGLYANEVVAVVAWVKGNPQPKPTSFMGHDGPYHTVEDTLKERAATHGKYPDHAQCTQELKEVVRRFQMSWSRLTHCQREALDMILHKIGRVIAGNADHADHWHDIAGYAMLVEKEIAKGNVRITPTL